MKASVRWAGQRTWLAQTESGHAIVAGTAHEGGVKPGPSAMELVLMAAGLCSSWDVVAILEKARQKIHDVTVELDGERAAEPPRVFTRIHMRYVVTGRGLDPARVERAIRLSVEKYCSVTAMLEKTAEVTHDFKVVEAD